jgi:S-adenosylmethionine:tRNA ribosyltransferase-isomerase
MEDRTHMIDAATQRPRASSKQDGHHDASQLPCGAFDFTLHPELEAHNPPEARGLARDDVRLMVSRITDDSVTHARFRDIIDFLRTDDVLVINTSATINAALEARTVDGTPLEMHLSTRLSPDEWVIELRAPGENGTTPYLGAAPGDRILLPAGGAATLEAPHSRSGPSRLWRATLSLPAPLPRYLAEHGFPIRYGYVRERWPLEYYQTVFTTEAGSAEMPSAGRAFTPELITRLVANGVEIVPLLLHTGVASLEEGEEPYAEYYRVTDESARRITAARAASRRIIAAGTTVVRTLETVTDADGVTHAGEGWTDVVVTPSRPVRGVNGLLTGFHEPRASHLLMLAAIAGCGHLRVAYAEAIRHRYLWHEFGDLHLVLPD